MDEDEYFKREDAEKLRKLSKETAKALTQAQRDALRTLHAGHCPSCGMEMQKLQSGQGLTILNCYSCGGTFLDRAASAQLVQHNQKKEHKVVDAVLGWFTHGHDED